MKNNKTKTLYTVKDAGFGFTFMICVYVIISFACGAIVNSLIKEKSTAYYLLSSLFSLTAIVIILVVYSVKTGNGFLYTASVNKFNPIFIVIALLFATGMFLGFGAVNSAVSDLIKKLGGNVSSIELPVDSVKNLCLFLLFFAVITAIIEEFFFRGFILNALNGANIFTTALSVGLAFALYHGSASQFIYQFIYGTGLTLIAISSCSVIPCIIAHLFNNAVILVFKYLESVHNISFPLNLTSPIVIAVGLILVALSMFLTLKLKPKNSNGEKSVKEFWLPFGLFGVVICLTLIISGVLISG